MAKKVASKADKEVKQTRSRKKTTKKKPNKPSKPKKGLLKRFWSIGWKVSLAAIVVIVFAGVYLDSLVKQKFEGQLFALPTVVYARILYLTPGDQITIQELRNELNVLNYRKVRHPRYPGSILLLQRK